LTPGREHGIEEAEE